MLTVLKDWIRTCDQKLGHLIGTYSSQPQTQDLDVSRISCVVVDDDAPTRELISAAISGLGASTAQFDMVDDLLRLLEYCKPEFIFLDITLRDSDAIEAIRELGRQKFNGIVQLISGQTDHVLAEVHAIGMRHQLRMLPPLRKPCSIQTLRDIARTHLRTNTAAAVPVQQPVDLGLALRKDWVEVWYQPKIDLRRKALVGLEALARINHPQLGMVQPCQFLPQAGADTISRLTEHVLITTMNDWACIRDTGFIVKPAVNLSVECLSRAPIAKLLRRHRPSAADWPGMLLELTEDQIIKDFNSIKEISAQIKLYDAMFSIDDFGSGYSSFERLKQIAFAEIKLDGSYVQGCATDRKNASICRAIIDLAHNLGAQAVAERVDDRDDLMALYEMGCDLAQGYLLCRPLPLSDLTALLKQKADKERRLPSDQPARSSGFALPSPRKQPRA